MMPRMFKHAVLVIGGLGATVLVGGCSALGLGDGGLGSSRTSDDTYEEQRDARSASGRYDSTYDRYGSSRDGYGSSSDRYDSSTGRYDSTPGYNDYEERKARRAADQYNGRDRTYEERKAARQRDAYNNGY